MRVVVAEKPSVARDLARVLGASRRGEGFLEGGGLRITWCHGHMAELEEPSHYQEAWKRWSIESLPMVPEPFALRLRQGATDQFQVLRRLLRDPATAEVVNACDAGREGELIFRYVAELAGCTKPVLRLWTSSLTDAAIRDAWSRLAPGTAFDRLGDAARSRAEADWLVGMNATRALTVRARDAGGSDLLSVGRVQTPTLAMIVARDLAIEAFVPEDYWVVSATFDPERDGMGTFHARFFARAPEGDEADKPPTDEPDDEAPKVERVGDAATAEAIAAAARGQLGVVEAAERRRTRERPPLLYDLTSLQRRANQRYGLSASRTLEVAQALYERHKLLTYPRTDSRYLSPDQVPTLPDVVAGLVPVPPYAATATALLAAPIRPGPRVVNGAEVGDHPAIIPTGRTPPPDLDPDEKRVFDLVARRLMAALMDDAVFDLTRLVVRVEPGGPLPPSVSAPLRFRARGRVCVSEGWRAIDPPGKSVDTELPAVQQGDPARATDARSDQRQTRPPRHYNDASVLQAMETAGKALDDETLARALRGRGLGTPATRAAILQTLLDRGYAVRQGRELHATDKGRALIGAIPVEALKNAELTADWEGRLSEMADGRGAGRAPFMRDVARYVGEVVAALAAGAPPTLEIPDTPVLGPCPRCGKPVRDRGRRYQCDGGADCGFVVFQTMAKRKISARAVTKLLAEGRSPAMKGFKSRAGKDFEAGLRWDPDAGRVSFWFPDREDTRAEPPASAAPPPPPASGPREGDRCPACGAGTVVRGRVALGCSRWREGCGFRSDPGGADPRHAGASGVKGTQPRRSGAEPES
ncbi:MAG: DNA topoisomerase 3 [Myxococcota bacterium]